MAPSVTPLVVVFIFLTFSGFASLHLFPALKTELFPVLASSLKDGASPDGIPMRKHFTGHHVADAILSALTSFFTAMLDGSDEGEATRWFTVWFLPQCSIVLAFWYWEAGRARFSPLRSPLIFGLVAQLLGIGVGVPLVYLVHILTVPIPPTSQPRSAVVRAKTLLPAILLGLIAPSIVMLFVPLPLHTKQLVAAIWQPFPAFISIVHLVVRVLHPETWTTSQNTTTKDAEKAFETLRYTYYICAILSATAHITVLLPSLLSSTQHLSFSNVFLPFYVSKSASEVTYRHAARLFLHHDFISMAVSSFVFFGWSHYISRTTGPVATRPKVSFVEWVIKMAGISLVASPGAAIAWAAIQREEQVLVAIQTASKKN